MVSERLHKKMSINMIAIAGTSVKVALSLDGKIAENSPVSLDLGVRFAYNRAAWLGVQYRTSNAIVFQVGANIIKNLYVAYGYEVATGKIRTASNGSHEIQLGFYLGRNRNMDREIKGKKKGEESI